MFREFKMENHLCRSVVGIFAFCCYLAQSQSSNVVPAQHEKKIATGRSAIIFPADALFLQRQKQIMRLYIGPKQSEYYSGEFADFDLRANAELWENPKLVTGLVKFYEKQYALPKNGIFTLYEPWIRKFTLNLFDVFYFAKDFETFFKAASWAKKHVEPVLFVFAYTLALYHRPDTQSFTVPPMYEVFPDYFLPQETIHEIFKTKLMDIKDFEFNYNNSGCEYNYNSESFGGVLDYSINNQHLEYKLSYFREDIGLNSWYLAWQRKYPGWLASKKHGKDFWFRRGEGFYYTHQQLLARYMLERIANGLPNLEILKWDQPQKVGYNPRVSHPGGQPFIARPDNMVPNAPPNHMYVEEVQNVEKRLYDAINMDGIWNANDTLVTLADNDGIDLIGKIVYGSADSTNPKFYKSYYYQALQALSNVAQFRNNFDRNTGVLSCPFASLRDPMYFNFLGLLVSILNRHKNGLPKYSLQELSFPQVKVEDVKFDKLSTYFELYKFSVFNAVPVKNNRDYKTLKYWARQYRLNHKPYSYNLTVVSGHNEPTDGIVRLYLGPKFDSLGRLLSLEQRRPAMFEIDRFPVKINPGINVYERASQDSPIFAPDEEGIRETYERIAKANNSAEPYYYYPQKATCGFPDRLQLPRGTADGRHYVLTAIVSRRTKRYTGDSREFYTTCGSPELYDFRPLGFPFDRPVDRENFDVENILSKDVPIFHNDILVQ